MLELNPELLDEWCENIKSEGYIIESAMGFDDIVYISFSPTVNNEALFNDSYKAEKFFKDKMPDDLYRQVLCYGFDLRIGSCGFVFNNGINKTIGYIVCLRRK